MTCDGWGGICRSIVDDDHLVVWVPQLLQTFEAFADGACAIITANDDRNARPSHIRWKRHVLECLAYHSQGRLWTTVAGGQAEIPLLNVEPSPMPLIRPGEDHRPSAPGGKRRSDLPV